MSADTRLIKTAAETTLAESFAAAKTRLPGKGEIALRREEAFRRFEQQGLPHRRVEEWKYTDLRALMRDAKPVAAAPGAAEKARAKEAGRIAAGDADVAARLGASSTANGDIALALNTAFMGDGAVLRVAPGATVERPIH